MASTHMIRILLKRRASLFFCLMLLAIPSGIASDITVNVTVPVSLKEQAWTSDEISAARLAILDSVKAYMEGLSTGERLDYTALSSGIKGSNDVFWMSNPGLDLSGKKDYQWDIIPLSSERIRLDRVWVVPLTPNFFDELNLVFEVYTQNLQQLPEPFKTMFSNERINWYLLLADGTPMKVSSVLENGAVVSFQRGELTDPTLEVYTYENTIRRIGNADDPFGAIQNATSSNQLFYEGVGTSGVKYDAISAIEQVLTPQPSAPAQTDDLGFPIEDPYAVFTTSRESDGLTLAEPEAIMDMTKNDVVITIPGSEESTTPPAEESTEEGAETAQAPSAPGAGTTPSSPASPAESGSEPLSDELKAKILLLERQIEALGAEGITLVHASQLLDRAKIASSKEAQEIVSIVEHNVGYVERVKVPPERGLPILPIAIGVILMALGAFALHRSFGKG